jgi:hypothetical protein
MAEFFSRDDETYLIFDAMFLICFNCSRVGGAPTKGIKSSSHKKNEEASLVLLSS